MMMTSKGAKVLLNMEQFVIEGMRSTLEVYYDMMVLMYECTFKRELLLNEYFVDWESPRHLLDV